MENLRVAIGRNDTTEALFERGTVRTAPTLVDVFRLLVDGEADVAEFGLTFYLRSLDNGAPFLAVPAFPTRVFRHSCVFVHADSGITRPEDLERDWYRRTGIFPIMHTIAAPRGLLAARPGLAREIYDVFLAAKETGADRYRARRRLFQAPTMLPWANALDERNEALFGPDWWPYGIAANRTALDTFLRYHHEQGLSSRRWSVEEIFSAELLDT
ncbi:hypothetical protein ACQP2P_30810 [Dactylosporangium sp. CA-139114]|uniref:hypothetical protein n=1 Tax=Dactylosporangium sp. CA-139114 TaxID=3239931 RepID=UPI003D95517D